MSEGNLEIRDATLKGPISSVEGNFLHDIGVENVCSNL